MGVRPDPGHVAFYPSMVVNFLIRFDEAFTLSSQDDPDPAGERPIGPTTETGKFNVVPLISGGKADNKSAIMHRIPKSGTVELPGHRQAGKFNLTFAYADFPIDPRLIRSMQVAIHLGAVPAADFSKGMNREATIAHSTSIERSGSLKSVLQPTDANRILLGLVDSMHVSHSASGDEISMEGRDLRGLLLDLKVDSRVFKNLHLEKPINDVVLEIIRTHPLMQEVKVVVNEDDWKEPGTFGPAFIPSPASKDHLTRVRHGAAGERPTAQPAGAADKLAYWDLITQYCFLVGAIPVFVGPDIQIRPAHAIFDQQKAGIDPSIKTPFKDGAFRVIESGDSFESINVRRVVYGRDVESLNFERKFVGATPVIRCVSIDTSSDKRGIGRLIEGFWPKKPKNKSSKGNQKTAEKAEATTVAPSGGAASTEVLTVPVAGVKSKERLRLVARSIYEEIGRGEQGGSCSTKSITSFGGDNTDDPDLISLRPGDGVNIMIDSVGLRSTPPVVSEFGTQASISFNELVARIKVKVGDENLARVLAASARGAVSELGRFFRVNNVKFAWSGSGVGVAFDFQNFVESRHDASTSAGPNTKPPKRGSAPRKAQSAVATKPTSAGGTR